MMMQAAVGRVLPLRYGPLGADSDPPHLEAAGVEFIDENGGGPGVRLRRPVRGQSGK
jgi:hypothetical protein